MNTKEEKNYTITHHTNIDQLWVTNDSDGSIEAVFYGHSSLVSGDYGGAGSVGVANIRSLEKEFESCMVETNGTELNNSLLDGNGDTAKEIALDTMIGLVIVYYAYHGKAAFIRGERGKEILTELDHYPAIDDEAISQVESEWEQEAWDSYVDSDLLNGLLPEGLEDIAREAIPSDKRFGLYRQAMEDCNEYPVPEYDGVHISIPAIQEAYDILILEALKPVIDAVKEYLEADEESKPTYHCETCRFDEETATLNKELGIKE